MKLFLSGNQGEFIEILPLVPSINVWFFISSLIPAPTLEITEFDKPDKIDMSDEYAELHIYDAGGNLLSGSLFMGSVQGEGIELYGGSAYIRSIGYEGFQATISSGSGGFMIWSGSLGSHADGTNRLQTTESYEGVGLEIVDAHGAGEDRYLQFKTNPSTFKVVTNEFFLGSVAEDTFVSGSNNNIEIKSDNFHLTAAGAVTMAGTITATAGAIGGFTINSNTITATDFEIDPSVKVLQ